MSNIPGVADHAAFDPEDFTARDNEDWEAVAREQIADPMFPDIVAYDPELDDRCDDDEALGCLKGKEDPGGS